MTRVLPLRAIRYSTKTFSAEALANLVSPPYDVIDSELQEQLYKKSPYNFVRVDLNQIGDADDSRDNRYTRARKHLMDWMSEGILALDDQPAIYLYHQTFNHPDGSPTTRRGFFARFLLEPYEKGVILPHERTLRGPKVDRLNLMRETDCHLSPIFLLYRDEERQVSKSLEVLNLDGVKVGEPAVDGLQKVLDVVTEDGIRNELWRATGSEVLRVVEETLANRPAMIADGHHRYETALAYQHHRREHLEEDRPVGNAPYDYTLGFFVNSADPGLLVLPTHRVVHSLPMQRWDDLWPRLKDESEFDIRRLETRDVTSLLEILKESGSSYVSFVFLSRDEAFLVRFVGGEESDLFDPETPMVVRKLDAAILHETIFERMLDLSKEGQAAKTNLRYIRDEEEIAEELRQPETQFIVLMNPTPVEDVEQVCLSGGTMPQKSTFFFPKLLSGMLIYPA